MARCHAEGFKVKATRLSRDFDVEAFRRRYGASAIPLCVVDQDRRLRIVASNQDLRPGDGDLLVAMVRDPDESA